MEISVEHVSKSFQKLQALQDVTMTFGEGAMHGIIGPEGAGKTTLMRVILGLLKADQGKTLFREGKAELTYDEVRPSLAYMPQQQSLYPDLSIIEHLDFFKELYGIPEDVYAKRKSELLEITRLGDFVDRPAAKLSGGMYKKLGLMCALLRNPSVMLLDEPTNGVDPISRREFWELLYRLSDQRILILVTTAYMDEAERCGIVHLISEGRVVAEGSPRDLLRSKGGASLEEFYE